MEWVSLHFVKWLQGKEADFFWMKWICALSSDKYKDFSNNYLLFSLFQDYQL